LKHSSPTADPSAPNPLPQIVRPSAKTITPVAPSGRADVFVGSAKAKAPAAGFSTMSLSDGRYAFTQGRSTL
jgi:hypothetical protein